MIEHVKPANVQGIDRRAAPPKTGPKVQHAPFADLLAQAQRTHSMLRFSAHAMQRLDERNITLSEPAKAALQQGVERAAAKGSRETLLLTEDAAFVVSVPNRTVITAVPRGELDDAVFTNIDSAVVMAPTMAGHG